jgi:membrane-bound lytic murein transglycosylase B
VITRYNRSEKYALAAFELSQAIEQEYRSETDSGL